MTGPGPPAPAVRPADGGIAASVRGHAMLALGESRLGPWYPSPWIGTLLILGSRAARYARHLTDRQLVVVISLPTRDYAAVLIGCGWMFAAPRPNLAPPAEIVTTLAPGTPVRVVTGQYVITDYFNGVEHGWNGDRIKLSGRPWMLSHVKAVTVLDHLEQADRGRQRQIPLPGSMSDWVGVSKYWEEHLAAPPSDLAIVGTRTWLEEELSAGLSRDGLNEQVPGDELRDLLLPHTGDAATWSTQIYPASKFDPEDGLSADLRAIVLDGANTSTYLSAIEVPVVFVVLDRRAADDTAAEAVLLHRSSGEPLSLADKLQWLPSAGIEALAYTVPL